MTESFTLMIGFVHCSPPEGGGYPIAKRIPYAGSPDLQPEVKLGKGSIMFIVCYLYSIKGATIKLIKVHDLSYWHIVQRYPSCVCSRTQRTRLV